MTTFPRLAGLLTHFRIHAPSSEPAAPTFHLGPPQPHPSGSPTLAGTEPWTEFEVFLVRRNRA